MENLALQYTIGLCIRISQILNRFNQFHNLPLRVSTRITQTNEHSFCNTTSAQTER